MAIAGAPWALFSRKLKDPSSGLGVELQLIRELAADELETIRKSARLLRQFRSNWGWTRYLNNRRMLEAALVEARAAAEASSGTYNQAHLDLLAEVARSLMVALSRWAEQMREPVRSTSVDVSEGLLARARAIYEQDSEYVILAAEANSGNWSTDVATATSDGGLSTRLVLQPAGVEVEELGQHLHDHMLPLAAVDLMVNRGAIEDATRLMYQLRAEVLYGLPCLLQPEAVRSPSDHQVDVEDLPLGLVEGVLNAIRVAEAIDGQSSAHEVSIRREDEDPPEQVVGHQDAHPDGANAPEPIRVGGEAIGSEPDEASPADSGAASTGSPSHAVVDWQAFAQEAFELADEVEGAWSTALKDAVIADTAVMTRISSFLSVALREIDEISKNQQASGLSSEIPRFPLQPEGAAAIEFAPGEQQRATQLGLARVYAIKELTDSLVPLRSSRKGEAPGKRFWESGAFSRTREIGISAAGLVFGEDAEPDWHSYLHGLRWALAHGFVEAGVVYASLALHAMPRDSYEIMAGNDRTHYDAIIRKLDALLRQFAAGDRAPIFVTWPLACFCRDSLAQFEFLSLMSHRRTAR